LVTVKELAGRAAHVAALWGLAAAGPLFELLGEHPEFFAARGSPTSEIVLFALGFALLPPLLLVGLEWLAGLVSRTLAWALQLAYVAVLTAAIVLQLLPADAWVPSIALGLAAGAAGAALYARATATRSVLAVLAPAPLVFAAAFLLLSDVSPLVLGESGEARAAGGTAHAPVVMVVFDELPVHSLMGADERIDARRYPNFARLAADSTWYRNTASVEQDTPYAVPAILDGRLPRRELLPVAADHPQNLFSLLAGRYDLHVREDATAMCAPRLCGLDADDGLRSLWHDAGLVYAHEVVPDHLEDDLPAVGRTWRRFEALADPSGAVAATRRVRRESKRHRFVRLHTNLAGGRARRFERFVDAIEGGSQPRLHFIHILLPHVPFRYLPSGTRYRNSPREALPGLDSRPGYGIPFLVRQSYQRHLLQLEATDRLLGELLDRLHEVDLYDRAAIAVVADHGMSFRLGHDHRLLRAANVADIAPVPFFMKLPGQRRGRISDKPLRTVDVLPTVADAIGVRIPWRIDGHSALDPTVAAQRRRRIISKKFHHVYPVDTPTYESDKRAALMRKLRLFPGRLDRVGPASELIGTRLSQLPILPGGAERAVIQGPARYRHVRPGSGIVPSHLVGRIEGGMPGGGRVIAVALNGRIAATGRTFTLEGANVEQFSLLIPERRFREGRNRLVLLLTNGSGEGCRARRCRGVPGLSRAIRGQVKEPL
jgi:hypothetical protein